MADGPELSRAERLSLAVTRFVNERPRAKRIQHLFLSRFNQAWVKYAIGRRIFVDDVEWLLEPPSDRGVLLCMNHRSYFDAYITMFSLYELRAFWADKIYFPVRSNFFYEHPVGFAVNLVIGGGALYPPIFRDASKADLNRDALDRMVRFLDQPGALVGMHPEGTRGKGPDPYQLLPAQPGVGQVVLRARPMVVPAFVNGLSNSYAQDITDTYRKDIRRERPIIIVFGRGIDYSDLAQQKPRAALYKRTADRIRDAIIRLGEREREIRAACLRGEILDDHPGWVMNHALGRRE
jgi:1-acyl-sn-glycerol-3-phosphate acyltransferase